MSLLTRKTPVARTALGVALVLLALTLVPVAHAGKGGTSGGRGGPKGGGGGSICTQSAPGAAVQNTYGWSQ
jgi:hypothetical protein